MKILVVDDDQTNRKLLRLTLESLGHEIVEAEDGKEALQRLTRDRAGLVISDILMPNLDGYRFCFEARQSPEFANLPIILYSSSYTSPSDRDLALRFGASLFLEKPASSEMLQAAIHEVLGQANPAPPGDPAEDLGLLKQYSARLIAKIEEKNLELQQRSVELAASEEKFRQLAENIQEVFFMTSADFTRILYISPAYEVIWGRSCHDLYADAGAWLAAIHPEDRDRIMQLMVATVKSPAAFSWEYRIERPDKSVRHIHARGVPVRDDAGRIYRVAGIAEDMTERNSLQSQLVQSQKMEAVGRLAGGIAHDFNNLLTAINGYAQLAMRKLDRRDPSYTHIEQIHGAGERAASLTRQLLAFSRKQILQPRVVNLNAMVLDLERLLGRLIGEDVQLSTSLGEKLGSVRVDPGQIDQVIVNLAVNARDAMPNGGKLTLQTANVDLDENYALLQSEAKPGRHVMIAVSDTGTGMTPEVRAHLFEPFFTTKGPGAGTGLGLATAHGIIKQSGGFITAYSEVGHGTTFKVYLPRVDEAPEQVQASAARSEAPRGDEVVLLVEDEKLVRALAKSVLVGAGYFVLDAGTAEEALLILERHPGRIHLLLTDLVMPGMGGPDLARRAAAARDNLRILYMSGYTDTGVLRDGVLGPEVAFLGKPFTPDQLLIKVRAILDAGAPAP